MSTVLSNVAMTANVQAGLVSSNPSLSGNLTLSDQTNVTPTVGSAAGSADGAYTISGSVVAGTPLVINLAALTDPYGNALTVGHVVGIKITNTSALGAGTLSHGGGTNPIYAAMPSALAIAPGDYFSQSFNAAGLVMTSGSLQNLQITASTGTVTYKVTIIVRSA